MTTSPSLSTAVPAETPAASASPAAKPEGKAKLAERKQSALPVLEQLFGLYPHLFGAEFLPLKRGIFQDLLARHPEVFQRDSLKAALAVHARSTSYLQCVAAAKARHDLDGVAVEEVAPEHVYQAVVELHRRRQARTQDDLSPKLRAQLSAAFEASGLSPQDYRERVQPADEAIAAVLDEALSESTGRIARQEALNKAFEASGKNPREFAEMYGVQERDVIKS
ncbi:MAG: ProQ/FINO family protein, partial [Rhodocyclaceae bacterium]|nr:ProQ/FINO family protein [Rhodocyclaceae bacterium]